MIREKKNVKKLFQGTNALQALCLGSVVLLVHGGNAILISNKKLLQAAALTPFFLPSNSLQVDAVPTAWPIFDFKQQQQQQQQTSTGDRTDTLPLS
jgi:hypothetical protein